MHKMAESNKTISLTKAVECMHPLLGTFVGFVLGFTIQQFITDSNPVLLTDSVASFLMLVFAVHGWALERICHGNRLWCGGKEPRCKEDVRRYSRLLIVSSGLMCLCFFFCGRSLLKNVVSFLLLLTQLAMLAGEIGWGKPLWIFYRCCDK